MSQLDGDQPVPFDSPHASWFFNRLNQHPRFAHHPLCSCFDNHLFRFGQLNLCLGCTCLTIGLVGSSVMLIVLVLNDLIPEMLTSLAYTWFIGVALYSPSLVQPFLQVKIFKIVSRTCLGVAIAILVYGALFLLAWDIIGLGIRIGFVLIFRLVFRLTNSYRKRFTDEPTTACDKGCYPFCGGNEVRLNQILCELIDRADPEDPLIEFAQKIVATRDGHVEMSPKS